jgi:4-amino-4-deoxy-L-arabinose transferase-like glycosyltransferase
VAARPVYFVYLGFGDKSAWPDLLVLGGSLLVLLWGLNQYGLYEPHEGHFAGAGREMLLTGDWLTPHLNGSPYLNKPPLIYWLIAFSQDVFGFEEWAARLPVALFGWLGVLVAWWWGRSLWGAATGRLAAGMLTVSVGWFLFVHQILIDAILAALLLAVYYFLWRAVCDPRPRWHWLGVYLTLALGLLAKWPVPLPFFLFVLIGFALVRRRWETLRHAGLWWGLPLAVLPIAAWALWVEQDNPGFLRHAFVSEVWDRMRDVRWPRDYAVSQVSLLGYLAATAVWCAPWVLLLPQVWGFVRRGVVPKGIERSGRNGQRHGQTSTCVHSVVHYVCSVQSSYVHSVQSHRARRDALVILSLGFLGPVLVFLPIPSRLIYYCLPALPPLVLLVAGWWLSEDQPKAGRRAATVTLAVLGAVAFSAGWWVAPLLMDLPEMQAAPATLAVAPVVAWWLGAAFLSAALFLWQERPRAAATWLCVLLAVMWAWTTDGFVAFQDLRSSKHLVARLDAALGPDALWVAEGSYELGASAALGYYLGVDKSGQPRTVRVMTDNPHRPQPQFGDAPRNYALEKDELQLLWDGPRPVLWVSDPMRRDWNSVDDAPRLPDHAGEPVTTCGYRRVFANAPARERLTRAGLVPPALAPDGPHGPADGVQPQGH